MMRSLNILDVAQRLGVRLKRVSAAEWAGPCPRCGGRDRFSVSTAKGLFYCRRCGGRGDAIALARFASGISFKDALAFVGYERAGRVSSNAFEATSQTAATDLENNRLRAIALWRRRRPIVRTLAEEYLRRRRGYTGVIPATIAFLPGSDFNSPAMISAYGNAAEPEPGLVAIHDSAVRAVHLTKLTNGGDKLGKITFGRGAAGAPIIVAPPNDLLGLVITEGIEDALSVHAATGLGAWAAGCAGFMPALADAVPDYIEQVTIIADADPVGQRGAHRLAERLLERRIEAAIKTLRHANEAA